MTSDYKNYLDSLYPNAIKDNEPTVELHVEYNNGILTDLDTGNLIQLRNNSVLTVRTSEYNLLIDDNFTVHTGKYERKIADKGEEFSFGFNTRDNMGMFFKLKIEEDLIMRWKGKKQAKLQPCACVVYQFNNSTGNLITANSLNNAYTKTSIQYRPDYSSHTCNVFKVFVDSNNIPLEERRRVQYTQGKLTKKDGEDMLLS